MATSSIGASGSRRGDAASRIRSSSVLASPSCVVAAAPARLVVLGACCAADRQALGLAPGEACPDALAAARRLGSRHPGVDRAEQLGGARVGGLGPWLAQRPYRGT